MAQWGARDGTEGTRREDGGVGDPETKASFGIKFGGKVKKMLLT